MDTICEYTFDEILILKTLSYSHKQISSFIISGMLEEMEELLLYMLSCLQLTLTKTPYSNTLTDTLCTTS
jgi:hypothetical protein